MADLRSQNKGLAGCPKRSERVAGCLACREWLVVSPTCRGGGVLVGWTKGRGSLHQFEYSPLVFFCRKITIFFL